MPRVEVQRDDPSGNSVPHVRMRQAQRDGGGARVTSSRQERIPAAEPTSSIAIFTPSPPASALSPRPRGERLSGKNRSGCQRKPVLLQVAPDSPTPLTTSGPTWA